MYFVEADGQSPQFVQDAGLVDYQLTPKRVCEEYLPDRLFLVSCGIVAGTLLLSTPVHVALEEQAPI